MTRRHRLPFRYRPHCREQSLHLPFAQIPGNENKAAPAIAVGPAVEFDRRMGEVLHELHHHRAGAASHIQESLHPQQVRATQRNERLHGTSEGVPGDRLILDQGETRNIVRMGHRIGDKACAKRAGALGKNPLRVERAGHRFSSQTDAEVVAHLIEIIKVRRRTCRNFI